MTFRDKESKRSYLDTQNLYLWSIYKAFKSGGHSTHQNVVLRVTLCIGINESNENYELTLNMMELRAFW